MYELESIKPSTRSGKKKMAIFYNTKTGRTKTTHFGSYGMSDYTKHKDKERKRLYIARHKTREDWGNPVSAGALSRWILWNKPSYRDSVRDYKKRFNF
jgi:hypothetical protein